ncbi:MAG: hypothetical protein IJ613_10155 [Muribaculaceae bacterium]|nr:hypothetical protein [Muribaculaceae bacterium]
MEKKELRAKGSQIEKNFLQPEGVTEIRTFNQGQNGHQSIAPKWAEKSSSCSIAFANLLFTISNFAIANLEMIFETRKFLIVNFKI